MRFLLKICTRNRRQIRPDATQMNNKLWFRGACVGGRGAQLAQKPTRMHFRMRKPLSWLTHGGCFLVQFVFFFGCFFVIAPAAAFYKFVCYFEHIFDNKGSTNHVNLTHQHARRSAACSKAHIKTIKRRGMEVPCPCLGKERHFMPRDSP